MPRFRKKPVVIEAIQFTGGNDGEILSWATRFSLENPIEMGVSGTLYIHTLEGQMTVSKGDWVIKGVQGEFYPCKPDIFEATYEAVEDDTSLPEDYWETAQ